MKIAFDVDVLAKQMSISDVVYKKILPLLFMVSIW